MKNGWLNGRKRAAESRGEMELTIAACPGRACPTDRRPWLDEVTQQGHSNGCEKPSRKERGELRRKRGRPRWPTTCVTEQLLRQLLVASSQNLSAPRRALTTHTHSSAATSMTILALGTVHETLANRGTTDRTIQHSTHHCTHSTRVSTVSYRPGGTQRYTRSRCGL